MGEARDRVRAACHNSGVAIPPHRITVNLSPASIPKAGTSFDLAIAVAVLMAGEVVPEAAARDVLHLGELGLDGRVRPVRGVLPAVLAAAQAGIERAVVPTANVREAELVPGVQVLGADTVGGLVARYRGEQVDEACDATAYDAQEVGPSAALDLADVVGQTEARLALEVAAAGGHHVYLLGPPGAGKTMLAARLPGILPDLTPTAALEVTAVHSLAGSLAAGAGLITRPPFVDPHHTASAPAIVGGGSGIPRPGAASRAHHGVLFLDEAPEFERRVLDALRQPLECGELVIHRAAGQARYPARFQLVLAANPCPCGLSSGKGTECTCTPMARPAVPAPAVGPAPRPGRPAGRGAARDAGRAGAPWGTARAVPSWRPGSPQPARLSASDGEGAAVELSTRTRPGHELRRRPWRLAGAATASVDRGVERGTLTVRGYDRVLRTAWTLADLDGQRQPARATTSSAAFALRQQAAA